MDSYIIVLVYFMLFVFVVLCIVCMYTACVPSAHGGPVPSGGTLPSGSWDLNLGYSPCFKEQPWVHFYHLNLMLSSYIFKIRANGLSCFFYRTHSAELPSGCPSKWFAVQHSNQKCWDSKGELRKWDAFQRWSEGKARAAKIKEKLLLRHSSCSLSRSAINNE